MPDTLLALLLLIIGTLAVVGLALLIAEVLRGLALRNAARRQALVRDTRRQGQALQVLRRELAPYRSLHAPQFQAALAEAEAPLREQGGAAAPPTGLYFPALPDGGLALGYLLQHPGDGLRIVRTTVRLQRWRRRLIEVRGRQARVRAGLAALHQMPGRLAADASGLQTRLDAVQEALQAETAAGMASLADAQADAGRLAKRLGALDADLAAPNNLALPRQDVLAQALADAAARLDRMEAAIERVRGERAAFDEIATRAETALTTLARSQPVERRPPLLDGVLGAAEAWLAAAQDRRQTADFAGGQALLARAEAWLACGEVLATALAEVAWLVDRRGASLQAPAIDALEDRLDATLARGGELLSEATSATEATPEGEPARLVASLRAISAEAATLRDQDEATAARLTQAGDRQMAELLQAWDGLQQILPLAADDPLARRYRATWQRWEAAAGSPARLQEALAMATEVRQDIEESAWFLEQRLDRARALAQTLPEQMSAAEALAGDWRCLAGDLSAMQQQGLIVQQRWLNWRHPGTLAEAHEQLDELKLAFQAAQSLHQGLTASAAQLERQAGIYEQTLATIQAASNLDPSRRLRLTALARMHYGQAERDARLDEALESLQKAEAYLRELVVR